jgi:hypothetical protein
MDEQDNPIDSVAQSIEDQRKALLARQTQLQQGLQQRTSMPFDPTLMRISQALLSPTKSGSFGESLGMGVQALMEGSEQEQLRQQNMLKMQEELEQKKEAVRQGLLKNAVIKQMYQSNPQLGQALAAFSDAAPQILPAFFKTPEVAKPSDVLRTKMVALGINPDDFPNLTQQQAQVVERYSNAANEEQRAAAQRDAAKLFFETGTRGSIPQGKAEFFNTPPVAGGAGTPSGQTPTQSRAVVAQAPAQPQVIETRQIPIIEQVTPKQKSELLLDKPNQISTVTTVNSTLNQVENSIDKLLNNESGLRAIVGVSGMIPNIPGRPPAIAATDLQTLKSKVAVQAIQAMRDASKTGGAVGSVTEREWPRLEAQFGNLQQAQDYESIKQALENIKEIVNGTRQNIVSRYESTYGKDDSVSSILKRSSKPEFTVPGARDAFDKYKPRNQ